jgi:hypothetical protein
MPMMTVYVQRKGRKDREIRVRVTDAEVDATAEEQGYGPGEYRRGALTEDLARQHAARRMYGRGVWWQSDSACPDRGQIWTSARDGGADAVTYTITMAVYW